MECNKDEASNTKVIAERKLSEKDYAGAKKFALKAQALYPPRTEGISQLMMIIDVFISAEKKVSCRGEVDWYGVMGASSTADYETLRKQYLKLALMIHPDKSKCIGADDAFKLVSEAWSILSDKTKRDSYNQRRTSYYNNTTNNSSKASNVFTPTNNVPKAAKPFDWSKCFIPGYFPMGAAAAMYWTDDKIAPILQRMKSERQEKKDEQKRKKSLKKEGSRWKESEDLNTAHGIYNMVVKTKKSKN